MRNFTFLGILMLFISLSVNSKAQPFRLVKDINLGSSSNPKNFAIFGNELYFSANDLTHGEELWKSDATTGGTILLKDIYPGIQNGFPSGLTKSGSLLYFQAFDPLYGNELWSTNGTTGGTVIVNDIWPYTMGSFPNGFVSMEGSAGPTLYFSTESPMNGRELWKCVGNNAVMVYDLNPFYDGSYPFELTSSGGVLYFVAYTMWDGTELFRYNQDEYSPYAITNFNPGEVHANTFKYLRDVNGALFFVANDLVHGEELWKISSLGTPTLVKDIVPGSGNSYPSNLVNVNGILFFSAFDLTHGTELWRSDGTDAGTYLVKDINIGISSGYPENLTNVDGLLYFTVTDPIHGKELWKTNGTEAGTVLVKDIWPGITGSSIFSMKKINNMILFTANNGVYGAEVWRSDGTEAGTVMVQDIVPGSGSSGPRDYIASADNIFFVATTEMFGTELWSGTISGALPVSKIDLNGILHRDNINLEWKSYNELNVEVFEVQRSTDGVNYESVGEVVAKGRADLTMSYYFTDHIVHLFRSPIIYYRLRIIDKDGTFKYSGTIAIKLRIEASEVVVWPNPVQTELELRFTLKNNEMISLKLFDQQGRLMLQQEFPLDKGLQNKSISLSAMGRGIYILSITGKETNKQFKLVKQ